MERSGEANSTDTISFFNSMTPGKGRHWECRVEYSALTGLQPRQHDCSHTVSSLSVSWWLKGITCCFLRFHPWWIKREPGWGWGRQWAIRLPSCLKGSDTSTLSSVNCTDCQLECMSKQGVLEGENRWPAYNRASLSLCLTSIWGRIPLGLVSCLQHSF